MQEIIGQTFWGNKVLDYLIAGGIVVGGAIIITIIEFVFLRRLKKLAKKTKNTFDDFLVSIIRKICLPLAYFALFYIAVNTLALDEMMKKGVETVGVALLTIFTARFIILVANYGFNFYWIKRGKDVAFERSLAGILKVVKVLVWGLALVFFLDNLGFKISAVIAGLGVGGVAVALAAQAVLGDLFSYFAILFDRPFEIGDFIIVNEHLGVVEHIGIKTTRIRSLGGEQLVFSNSDLTNSRVRNYKRMEQRRVVFKFGVTYQTPLKKLKEIPKIVENIIKNIKNTRFDRAHFFSYGNFSLDFEIVYYVMGADYNKYMDIQQEINFAINEEFEKRGIDFAYPTQTLYVNKES